MCEQCKTVHCCSKNCQKRHWKTHKPLCEALNTLSKTNENEGRKVSFVTHLSAKQQLKISSLVGKKCEVACQLGKTESIVLWDTGSQVSILSDKFLRENFPNLKLHELSEILDEDCDLKLMAANNTPVPYIGYVEIEFELLNENSVDALSVPLLVSKADITNPIIGYNVIEEVIKQMSKGNTTDVKSSMISHVTKVVGQANFAHSQTA